MAGHSAPPSSPPRWLAALAFAAAYALAFTLSERGYGTLAVPSPFWLPDSILLCALLLSPRSQWWIFLMLVWPIRLVGGAVPGTPVWFQAVTIANDIVKAALAAWLIQRLIGRRVRLDTLNELLVFFAVAALIMPVLSAAAAAPARYALGDPVWRATSAWLLGDSLTQVVVTPTLLFWAARAHRHARARLAELLILCVALALTLSYAFMVPATRESSLALLYAPVPFLVWAAVRLRPFGTANAITLVALISIVGAVRGNGMFAHGASVLSLQLFLLLLAVSLLALAVVTAERETLLARERQFSALLFQAQEQERSRIARELHDDLGQQLAILKLDLHLLSGATRGQAASLAADAAHHADDVAASVREISHRLYPAKLNLIGLAPALKGLAAEVSLHGPRVSFTKDHVPERLTPDVTVALFRVAQEALQNAVKHSRAGQVTMQLTASAAALALTVVDDGVGFTLDGAWESGLGLASMSERVEAIGGTFKIRSAPGNGTRVEVTVPLPSDRGASIESPASDEARQAAARAPQRTPL